jgi:hypothetical protein
MYKDAGDREGIARTRKIMRQQLMKYKPAKRAYYVQKESVHLVTLSKGRHIRPAGSGLLSVSVSDRDSSGGHVASAKRAAMLQTVGH